MMNLARAERVASVSLSGNDRVSISHGQVLKIETSPNGIDVLEDGPPEGKVWHMTISIKLTEVDAA